MHQAKGRDIARTTVLRIVKVHGQRPTACLTQALATVYRGAGWWAVDQVTGELLRLAQDLGASERDFLEVIVELAGEYGQEVVRRYPPLHEQNLEEVIKPPVGPTAAAPSEDVPKVAAML